MTRDPHCTLCPLHRAAEHVCLLGSGPRTTDVMIVGEAPGAQEDKAGLPFVGNSGQLLDKLLTSANIERSKVFVTNAVSCRPPDNRTPKKNEIAACKVWLDRQIKQVKPKYILALGNTPLLSLTGQSGITKLRGRAIEHDDLIIFPTFHPSATFHAPGLTPILEQDIKNFKQIIDAGGIPVDPGVNFTIVDTWAKVNQMLDSLTGIVSVDHETTCLYPWAPNANIVTTGFGTQHAQWDIPLHHRDSPWSAKDQSDILHMATEQLNECCTTVYQNGKYDQLWTWVRYGLRWPNHFDTMLAHYLIDENQPHDLEYIAKFYFGAQPWDIPLKEKQGAAPFKTIARYHAHDLHWTRRSYFKLKAELDKEPKIKRVFTKLLMPMSNLYVEMEHKGCYIDTSRMDEVEKHLLQERDRAELRLRKWGKISWSSPKQVSALLYDKLKIKCPLITPKGHKSTAESALKQLQHPCVTDLLKLRGASQLHSFFIEGWRPFIVDSRIHPSFKLHGTVAGRPSCEHPNFQQTPRNPLIRTLVTAPPGFSIVEGDLSQIELRIAAELSQCPAMMHAFRNSIDIHWLTALREVERGAGLKDEIFATVSKLTGTKQTSYGDAIRHLIARGPKAAAEINPMWKEVRDKAKAVNFGYLYGMWWKKFITYARDEYDIHLTEREAQDSRRGFFQLYPLEEWHKKQHRMARSNGFVTTLSGRKRRLPIAQEQYDSPQRGEALRQAVNAPVQGFASDINLMVLLQIADEFPRRHVHPLITVHDSILLEVRDTWVLRVCRRLEEIMTSPSLFKQFDITLTVPICGETKIGPWGGGVSLKKWSST